MSDWYVTADLGGTGSRFSAYLNNESASTMDWAGGPGSFTLGVEQAASQIETAVHGIALKLGLPLSALGALTIGAAGSLNTARTDALIKRLNGLSPKLQIVTDGYGHLLASFCGEPGNCIAVGTGSVIHWIDTSMKPGMLGGWGFPVGDEGGGARLGLAWVQHLVMEWDKGQKIGAAKDFDNKSSFQQWMQNLNATGFAKLAPEVFAMEYAGYKPASQILDSCTQDLMRLVEKAPSNLPLAVSGELGKTLFNRASIPFHQAKLSPNDGLRLYQLGKVPHEEYP